jgi:hypothetical protein
MADADLPTAEFAKKWWHFHRLNISSNGDIVPIKLTPDAPYDPIADDIDVTADSYIADIASLGPLLKVLADTAPTALDVKFIGTTVLEDAYEVFGDRVFDVLGQAGLNEGVKVQILSGFRR